MISSFDLNNLDNLLKDFYTAVGIRISIFDDKFRLVTEYPKEAPLFCRMIRSCERGFTGCAECDAQACKRAIKMRKPHIYTCHAGITEAITPIQIGGGVIGYAILAHMMPEEGYDDAVKKACDIAQAYGLPREESFSAVMEIKKKSAEQIHAAVKILDAVASYMYIQNLAQWKNEDVSKLIDEFINNNLKLPLTSEFICAHFHCSRTALYNISMKNFGMGIARYVTYCRIERAKALLSVGKSIADTSYECGFSEYNYFCKVFRKYTGMSAGAYRKLK